MTFKANGALFRNTEEKLRARFKDRYDASKSYPMFDGVINVPADQAYAMAEYLMNAQPDERGTILMRISGWRKEPQGGGDPYVSMAIEPDYRTLKAIEEAKATAVPAAAASLAAATGGVVVQADVF
ncbi:MAG: hypothetical protein EBY30_07400 [Rhodospirillales bacterium]|nr:hypothetical protein [Rhodospirillales bacterium]